MGIFEAWGSTIDHCPLIVDVSVNSESDSIFEIPNDILKKMSDGDDKVQCDKQKISDISLYPGVTKNMKMAKAQGWKVEPLPEKHTTIDNGSFLFQIRAA